VRLIVRGKIFTEGGITEGSVLIEEGRIARVAKDVGREADVVLDYDRKGHLVLPGLVDLHVHMRDFEQSREEDFHTGTAAAAKGGFTVVVDMPNTMPPVNSLAILKDREREAKSKAIVDYGLYCGVPEREDHLVNEIRALAVGFKVFMHSDFYTERRSMTERTLEFASRLGMPVVVHAEDPRFFVDTEMGAAGTPEAETSAIRDIAGRASGYGFHLHVTHLSSSAGVDELLSWKGRIRATADTCPHYLLLSEEDVCLLGAVAKVHPSIKTRADARALLEGLKGGQIDAVSSDHAPHLPEEKMDPRGASSGFPGLETALPLLLTMVNRGLLEMGDIVRVCAFNPARVLGLGPIGSIEEGKIGNLTVVDLHCRAKIDSKSFVSKAKYSPFEGWEVEGLPVTTIVRGQPVMFDGEVVMREGWGKNVKAYG
jgi:dihydroorotase (multifunctional complex type)